MSSLAARMWDACSSLRVARRGWRRGEGVEGGEVRGEVDVRVARGGGGVGEGRVGVVGILLVGGGVGMHVVFFG